MAQSGTPKHRPSITQPQSPFLCLPAELRHHIYSFIFANASTLILRSLFIRSNYINTFMTQQPRELSPAFLQVCRQISIETLPMLYEGPHWICNCRIDALARQIGRSNFARIRSMQVDVDDFDMIVEGLQSARQRRVHRGSGFAMQDVPFTVPDALRSDDEPARFDLGYVVRNSPKMLDFSNLEILEIEGYQSAALSDRGTHRVRVEALRLCELAMQLLDFHPKLKVLLQRNPKGDGGADARDLTLGRVRWRFVKDVDESRVRVNDRGIGAGTPFMAGGGHEEEHVVDLGIVRTLLENVLREDDRAVESSLPVAWTSDPTGRFNLYPFLQTV